MSTTVTYTASMYTKKYTATTNSKTGLAAQEFYASGYNFVGIVSFPGLNLSMKAVSEIQFTITADKFGANASKTAYLRKSNFQEPNASGKTGAEYVGDALGTFNGTFYNNTVTYPITGSLFVAMSIYIAQGGNTFTLYNPNPVASANGYSTNYFQWSAVTLTVTYDEPASIPTFSTSTLDLGTPVTIYTNRSSDTTTHTLRYSYGNGTGIIAENVGESYVWTPPVSLGAHIPNATTGMCTVTLDSYSDGTLIGSRPGYIELNVPDSAVPVIDGISIVDEDTNVAQKIGAFVQKLSLPVVTVTASGSYGSTITSYRTSLDGVTYTTASFLASKNLSTSGEITLTTTVTDSRGRIASDSRTLNVLPYAFPSITEFSAERCNNDGTRFQVDGTKIRYSFSGSVTPLDNKNALSCAVYYRLTSETAWTLAENAPHSSYSVSFTNRMLPQTFDDLASYEIKVRLTDYFYQVEQSVGIGTKRVILDLKSDGSGIAFGKVAENSGYVEFGWPLLLSAPLEITNGGTGSSSVEEARSRLGAVYKEGDTMNGDLGIRGNMYPSLLLLPEYNNTTSRGVVEGSFTGAASLGAWEDDTGSDRRMLEVRTKALSALLDYAVMLRVSENGTWQNFRVFHEGMENPIPISSGGTGANNAADALTNLGANNANNLTTGVVPLARLPFKVAYGSGYVSSSTKLQIDYSSAGFATVPCVMATYSSTGNAWSGDGGALKVYAKTTTGATIIVGGSFSTVRMIDWVSIGI